MIAQALRANRTPLVLVAGCLAATALVSVAFPPERDLESLLEFVLKLVPFVLAAEAIARLDLDTAVASALARVGLLAAFLVFFTLFVPQVFFYLDEYEEVYVRMQLITPFFVLVMVAAYRLGGGAASTARRLAYGLILIMLSGIEDLAFLTVNPHTDPDWATIPEVWGWADHMKVRLGHYPTRNEAFAFIAFHVAVGLAVLFVPLSWIRAIAGRLRSARASGERADDEAGGRRGERAGYREVVS